MEKPKTVPVGDEQNVILINGLSVTKVEAASVGKKASRNLQILAAGLVAIGVILGIRFAIDLGQNNTGWAMFFAVEFVFLGFAGALLWISLRMDYEPYGVSVLNHRLRMVKPKPEEIYARHDLPDAETLPLHLPAGNLIYLTKDRSQWQFRRKGKLSEVLAASALASFEIIKNGLKFDPSASDASGSDPL